MKKYRVRWGRVALLLIGIALSIVIIYYIVAGIIAAAKWCVGLFDTPDDAVADKVEVLKVSGTQLLESQRMTLRLDSLMAVPMRLDTSRIAVSVYDLTTRQPVYAFHEKHLLPPASCMKIATAVAALRRLGFAHTYKVSLLTRGVMKADTLVGSLMLLADDDPLFEDFSVLTGRLKQRGINCVRGNIYLNLARRDTLRAHPTAKVWDIPFNRTPVLLKGERHIERNLKHALAAAGVRYIKDSSVRPAGKYSYVATVSHRLTDVITPMMIHSSNIKADALMYHLDYKRGLQRDRMDWDVRHDIELFWQETFAADDPGTMRGFVFNDGSGLSPDNRLTAAFLVEMLKYAYADTAIRRYFIDEALATPDSGLRRGSLLSRMSRPEYRGKIFCKTGTMTTKGGSSLAGYIHSDDGHWYAFAIINVDSPVAEARIFQDKLCKMMIKAK